MDSNNYSEINIKNLITICIKCGLCFEIKKDEKSGRKQVSIYQDSLPMTIITDFMIDEIGITASVAKIEECLMDYAHFKKLNLKID